MKEDRTTFARLPGGFRAVRAGSLVGGGLLTMLKLKESARKSVQGCRQGYKHLKKMKTRTKDKQGCLLSSWRGSKNAQDALLFVTLPM